jgi:hypothetical protein
MGEQLHRRERLGTNRALGNGIVRIPCNLFYCSILQTHFQAALVVPADAAARLDAIALSVGSGQKHFWRPWKIGERQLHYDASRRSLTVIGITQPCDLGRRFGFSAFTQAISEQMYPGAAATSWEIPFAKLA